MGFRNDYRNLIRGVGPPHQRGVVGIIIEGNMMFWGNAIFQSIWLCPNPICHIKHLKYIAELPPPPTSFPVAVGTNLSLGEVMYLLDVGLSILGVTNHPSVPSPLVLGPSALEIWIDVASFQESLNIANPELQPRSQNKYQSKTRNSLSKMTS